MSETVKAVAAPSAEKEKSSAHRAGTSSDPAVASPMMTAAAGNQAIQRWALGGLPFGNGELTVGSADDPGEQEARKAAEKVTTGDAPRTRTSSESRKPASHAVGRWGGMPLPANERDYFESRFAHDFSDVRVHTDAQAQSAAGGLGARAFTYGQDIFFGAGRWAPGTTAGRRLVAHELTHTVQQRGGTKGLIQADFDSDFAGRADVPVAQQPARPPGTIRLTTYEGTIVWAPYGIYTPQQIPDAYQDQIMLSSQDAMLRNPGVPWSDVIDIQRERGENAGELTVKDLRVLSEGAWNQTNIRVMMARTGNEFRFVGFDTSTTTGGTVHAGFVESERGTGGIGRALFADRVVRALQEGTAEMQLEVYTTQRTERFHGEVFRTAGIQGQPSEGMHYSLNTRQMARIALAWSDGLSDAQRIELVPLATSSTEPTPGQAQAILQSSGAPGSGAPTSMSGFSAGSLEDMQRFGQEVNRNVRRPLNVENLEDLQKSEIEQRILNEHDGFASVGNRLYRLQREGEGTRVMEVTTALIWEAVNAPRGPATEPEPPSPRPVALDPVRTVDIGGEALEGPGTFSVTAGDVIIVNSVQTFEARDPSTGRPLIGMFEGGQWYRIVGPDGKNQEIKALTSEGVRPVEMGGTTVLAEPFDPEPMATPEGPGGEGGGGEGVMAAGGIIMVANEILGPIGAALQNQRNRIHAGEAEFNFWTALGANPTHGIWDVWGHGPASRGTSADTALFGTWYYPYISDIDAESLRVQLPLRIHNFYEMQLLLFSANNFGAFQEQNGRLYAVVNRPAHGQVRSYDITDAMVTVRARTLDVADAQLRGHLAARPESERAGRIFRIPPGTRLWRNKGGDFNHQILIGAGDQLGPRALVREIRRTDYWFGADMVFVEPVTADAFKAVAFTQYFINRGIEKVWHEAKDGGRAVTPSEMPSFGDGPLDSFQAGPETTGDQRFGFTNYTRDPETPGSSTIARGEVRAFWVYDRDLEDADEKAALPQ